jgi:enoyl-[acyl-carrier-protein] reductase (NADH)
VALFLVSRLARYITGENVVVDGGFSQSLFTGLGAWNDRR